MDYVCLALQQILSDTHVRIVPFESHMILGEGAWASAYNDGIIELMTNVDDIYAIWFSSDTITIRRRLHDGDFISHVASWRSYQLPPRTFRRVVVITTGARDNVKS